MAGSARLSEDHSGRTELKIQINPRLDAFLLDHVVAGAPLLPTVMQLDLAARALPACCAHREAPATPEGILLRDVVVGNAVRFDRPGPRELHLISRRRAPVRAGPEAFSCELVSPGEPGAHLTAVAERTTTPVPPARSPGAWAGRLPCGPDLVYPPFFHGATFAVVGRFGRSAAGLTARLALSLPPLRWAAADTVLQPRILELLLQCCGLWELADSGRMMVPAAIEWVHWHPGSFAVDPGAPAMARIWPRPGGSDGSRAFDGQVLGPSGSVLVTVAGYRTTDLGLPPNLAHAARLRRSLDAIPRPNRPQP
jgi:Polyketide synthase dehydratase